jgi:class 3 adenylate cyclase
MSMNDFKPFGVQTKLIALVLSASLVCILLTGLLSFGMARHLLAEAGYERLTSMRSSQAVAVNQYLKELGDHVMTLSEAPMTVDAARRFIKGFNQLPEINEAQKKELLNHYETEFVPTLQDRTGGAIQTETHIPKRPNERYLKYHYIVLNNALQEDPSLMEDAKDGSDWSNVHREYHKRFRRLASLFGYQDIMIADITNGNIVYNTSKEDDLGTNLLTGPYANSPAARVFLEVKKSKDPHFITFSDMAKYAPSLGRPTMFAGTTVFDGDDFIGALIFQLNNERIDNLLTANRNWQHIGMGKSGETYLIGEDKTFRSSPRFFLENPKKYLQVAKQNGLKPAIIDAIKQAGTPILIQPVDTIGTRNALAGKIGTANFKDYRGVPVVSSYQPIRFGPFEWGLLAEIDQSELFSGIGRLGRNLLLLAALLIPAMAFLTLKLAQLFIRPIRRLLDATEAISAGQYAIHIPVTTQDEFGELAGAFNAMSDRLGEREQCLKEQAEENHRLLLSILPASAASRWPREAKTMAEAHDSVTVLSASIDGWDDLCQSRPAEQAIQLFRELSHTLASTAEPFGVETLQTVGTSLLAVSGLSTPHRDHQQRAVDCALAWREALRQFNQRHQVNLSLDLGLHAGPLHTGVVRGERLSFDIWGETIRIARALHASSNSGGIHVSAPIVAALKGRYRFAPQSRLAMKGRADLPTWELVSPMVGAPAGGDS